MNKVCFTDCDGVHSSGVVYFDDWRNNQRARVFHPRDGHGVQLLKDAGWEVIMISGEADDNIFHRCDKLKIAYYVGKDKLGIAMKALEERKYDPENTVTAYIGDDIFDIPLLEYVDFPGVPHDALPELRAYDLRMHHGYTFIPYVTSVDGGKGAFREFAQHLLTMDKWVTDKQRS